MEVVWFLFWEMLKAAWLLFLIPTVIALGYFVMPAISKWGNARIASSIRKEYMEDLKDLVRKYESSTDPMDNDDMSDLMCKLDTVLDIDIEELKSDGAEKIAEQLESIRDALAKLPEPYEDGGSETAYKAVQIFKRLYTYNPEGTVSEVAQNVATDLRNEQACDTYNSTAVQEIADKVRSIESSSLQPDVRHRLQDSYLPTFYKLLSAYKDAEVCNSSNLEEYEKNVLEVGTAILEVVQREQSAKDISNLREKKAEAQAVLMQMAASGDRATLLLEEV